MPTLSDRLMEDQKVAMRARDDLRLQAIRMIRSAIQNAVIAKGKDLTDSDETDILAREVRQRRESIDEFRKGNRPELVAHEEAGLAVVMGYLPDQLSPEQLLEEVRKAIDAVGAKGPSDRGRLMGKLMPVVRGKADGREVAALVEELLGAGE
ncbi:MAG: GatB/YqeY domain-containing protein [Chloroflexi bacterium]|nr:GatB/YqeY domain-containing protein [Chloroflexota bacterium]